MTDDQLLLASAYLDGRLDAAGVARAEADPEVMAEVERQRRVRELLRAVEPPDPHRRDQAITAALRAAEPAAPTPAAVAPPPPVPLPRRPRRTWWGFAAAAAAVVVVAVGVVAALGGGGASDDDTFEAAPAATRAAMDATEDRTLAAPGAADTAGSEQESERDGRTDAADEAPPASIAVGAAPSDQLVPRLATPEELRRYAAGASSATGLAATASCEHDGTFVGQATYAGRAVEIFRDDATVTALDATTCEVVETIDR